MTAKAVASRYPSANNLGGNERALLPNSELLSRRHALVKRQSCYLYDDFYAEIKEPLECQKDFLTAVREEIGNSSCRNEIYRNPNHVWYNSSSLCEKPLDEREGVQNCSLTCSARQFFYMSCTHLSQKFQEISAECKEQPQEARGCLFDKGDFCFLKENLTKSVIVECYASANVTILARGLINCSAKCKQAVVDYKENSGCCAEYWQFLSHRSGPMISDIFFACGESIPDACTSFSPPSDFLECARINGSESSFTKSGTIVLFLALVIASSLINIT